MIYLCPKSYFDCCNFVGSEARTCTESLVRHIPIYYVIQMNVLRLATRRNLTKGTVELSASDPLFWYFVSARKSVEANCVGTFICCYVISSKIM